MEPGIIEQTLDRLYGARIIASGDWGPETWWLPEKPRLRSKLFCPLEWDDHLRASFGGLEPIYGNCRGGFLLGSWFKIATLAGPDIYGLYPIRELQSIPPIRAALAREPGICYFMDAANVWYYGVRDGELWCYDTDPDEFYSFGPMAEGFEQLLRMYEPESTE